MAPVSIPTEDDVRNVLRGVVDPELGADIVDLGMVRAIDVGEDGHVLVTVAPTISGCPLRTQIRPDVESKIPGPPGVADVAVKVGETTPDQRPRRLQPVRRQAA